LFLAIPVIFAPEIRRGLERLGRAGSGAVFCARTQRLADQAMQQTIHAVVSAASRLAARQHGALIILQRSDNLQEYVRTGVRLNAEVTPELLLQVFYPNTPLHDGAAIIAGNRVDGWRLRDAAFSQWYSQPHARTPDGAAPSRRPGYLGGHRCDRCGGFGRNWLDLHCTRGPHDPPPGFGTPGKYFAGFLPPGRIFPGGQPPGLADLLRRNRSDGPRQEG
jgi:hypothetical protein